MRKYIFIRKETPLYRHPESCWVNAMKSPRPPGRPPKADGEKRNRVNHTLSPEILELIRETTRNKGVSLSSFIERCVREHFEKEENTTRAARLTVDYPQSSSQFFVPLTGNVLTSEEEPACPPRRSGLIATPRAFPEDHFALQVIGGMRTGEIVVVRPTREIPEGSEGIVRAGERLVLSSGSTSNEVIGEVVAQA
jgi:hypothetical protein